MVLIIGGAYQGKLDFAKSAFGLSESDVFTCTGGERIRKGIDVTESENRRCAVGICPEKQPGSAACSADWRNG